jgi:hypothetical protein
MTTGLDYFDWMPFISRRYSRFPFLSGWKQAGQVLLRRYAVQRRFDKEYDIKGRTYSGESVVRSSGYPSLCLSLIPCQSIIDMEWILRMMRSSVSSDFDLKHHRFLRPEWIARKFLLEYFGLRTYEAGDPQKEDHGPVVSEIASSQGQVFELVLTRAGHSPNENEQPFRWCLRHKESDDSGPKNDQHEDGCPSRGIIDVWLGHSPSFSPHLLSAAGLQKLGSCLRNRHIHAGFNVCGWHDVYRRRS